ncbi:hypothetical protein KORDIASMS9_02320 [Kordia sp. SMS9]|uniref:hypothetical protein n=1 Tax=Kordia sp. SMS9 TaxID=2282170 RepID=UPI000E103F5C|nr:hypothetical protein [Kordia sp. SMS9]AXG70091.1 hypothetical protein KORDIASMS9_02320 [Kordia sp. SMS9]
MIRKLCTLALVLCTFVTTQAQEFEVPDYKLKKAEDYVKYEKDVVAATKWLIETPINSQITKRKEVSAFLLKWFEGTPSITFDINIDIVTFLEESPESFMIYLAGWASYCIENKDYKNSLLGNVRGIESVLTFYEANKKTTGKIKPIERYKKLQKKGKLEKHVKSKLKP